MPRPAWFDRPRDRARPRVEPGGVPPFLPRLPWIGPDLQTLRNFVVYRFRPRPDLSAWPGDVLHVPLADASGDRLVGRLNRPAPGTAARPLVLLVHGVSGCEWSAYMQAAAHFFLERGHPTLRLNLRGAGPSRGLCRRRYHAGLTGDLRAVLAALPADVGAAGVLLVGFSLGGSLVLNLLAEGAPAMVRAAAVVSAPLDIEASVRRVMRPRNAIYHHYLLQRIKNDWLRGAAPLSRAERLAARRARSVRALDELFTAPRAGFPDAAAYYAATSPAQRLATIATPTLLIHSLDDPWIGAEGYRGIDWQRLPRLTAMLVEGGGHVGFHARGGPWHHRAIASFFDRGAGRRGLMVRSEGRILTTHGGSLPRPLPLRELFAARARGQAVGPADLAAAIRAGVERVVPRQIAAGIDIGNNGEQPREGFFRYIQHRMTGFGGAWDRPLARDLVNYPELAELRRKSFQDGPKVSGFNPPKAIGAVHYRDRGPTDAECREFREVLARQERRFAEPFLTAPSPGIVVLAMKNEHYDSQERYLEAVAEALRTEYEAVHGNGMLLQIDAPDLAMERHFTYWDRPLAQFLGFVEATIEAINRALRNVPAERVRLHVCWGNYEGPHDQDVAMSDVLPVLLRARVGGFVLPLANPRHQHEWRCFNERTLGPDRILVAGVVDTTSNYLEHPEVVAERIERVARAIGDPSRVIAATDCGFDTTSGMGRVVEDVVWAKLRVLSEGARLASSRLFP